jgi:hypothetical protein
VCGDNVKKPTTKQTPIKSRFPVATVAPVVAPVVEGAAELEAKERLEAARAAGRALQGRVLQGHRGPLQVGERPEFPAAEVAVELGALRLLRADASEGIELARAAWAVIQRKGAGKFSELERETYVRAVLAVPAAQRRRVFGK